MDAQGQQFLNWLEADPQLTLKVLKRMAAEELSLAVSTTTISWFLHGKSITVKKAHYEPANMNNDDNKQKRKEYVEKLQSFMEEGNNLSYKICIIETNTYSRILYRPIGKHLIWMDETNFNLFCRRTTGRSAKGARAVAKLPCSKGQNIHVIGAISSFGPERIKIRRGAFRGRNANKYLAKLIDKVVGRGVPANSIVVICDNAPCHSRFVGNAAEKGIEVLRLGPYSPMLNPIENVWSVMKAEIKRANRIPIVVGPGVIEQRVEYLLELINEGIGQITHYLCSQAIVHSTTFHRKALLLENMEVGT